MFQELNNMLVSLTSLTLSLAANPDNTITVTVTPKGAKVSGALDTPLSLTGTAAELDEGFAGILTSYANKRQNLSEQLAATEAILEAAQKEAADKAKKSIAKPANKTSAPITDEEAGSGDEDDDEGGASCTAPTSPISTEACTPAAAPDAKALWD